MARGSAAAFHFTLILAIVALTFAIPFLSAKQFKEKEKELTVEKYSMLNTINSYELFRKSLESTWRISTAQVVFRASDGILDKYWYSYNPSAGRNIAVPESGCNSANPKICLPTVQDVSSAMADYMKDYTASIEGSLIPVNLVSMNVKNIEALVWPSYGTVTSRISHIISADFASGKTKISRQETSENILDSDFRKMVFAGYLLVQKAAEISDEATSGSKLKYNPVVPAPAAPEVSTLGFEDYRKKAGDYIAGKLKEVEEFYSPSGKRILHVRIDPDDDTEAWAFHLTDDKEHFTARPDKVDNRAKLDDYDHPSPGKECIIFAENEEGGGSDEAMVWYISPGGKIIRTGKICDGIYNGLGCSAGKNYIVAAGCKKVGVDAECSSGSGDFCIDNPPSPPKDENSKCSTSPDGKAGPHPGPESVGGEAYTTAVKNQWCTAEECDLLETQKPDGSGACGGSGSKYCFMPKYEILCDSSGYWRICDEAAQDVKLHADKTYKCNNKAWEESPESANIELIVSTGTQYSPSTLGVLPEQGGLVMKYDFTETFKEEARYYKDTGSGFSKEPFSLSVKTKDYLPVLDCSQYADGTRFSVLPIELPVNPDYFGLDMMCYQDSTAPRFDSYKEIYTCERWGYGRPTGLNADGPGYIDNDLIGGEEIGVLPNKYQCVSGYDMYVEELFCKKHTETSEGDSVKPEPQFAICCTKWRYNDNLYAFWAGDRTPRGGSDERCNFNAAKNTFCIGDEVVDFAKGEICDIRKECSLYSRIDAETNGCGYYCNDKGQKFECLTNTNNCGDHASPADFGKAYSGGACNEASCGSGKPTYDGHTNFADSTGDVTSTTCYNPGECRLEDICNNIDGTPHARVTNWVVPSTCNEYSCPAGLTCPVNADFVKFTCADSNDCTSDVCDGAGGCSNPPLTGTPCTEVPDGVCVSGVCMVPTPTPTQAATPMP